MTEKYIDLEERIKRDRDLSLTGLDRVTYTLRWLDRNPDQVPGRTITESDYRELTDSCSVNYQVGFSDGFFLAGGRIVPDPEPTNAERIEAILNSASPEASRKLLALFLDLQGVKAPGGNDD